jgi:hypothetical protein
MDANRVYGAVLGAAALALVAAAPAAALEVKMRNNIIASYHVGTADDLPEPPATFAQPPQASPKATPKPMMSCTKCEHIARTGPVGAAQRRPSTAMQALRPK